MHSRGDDLLATFLAQPDCVIGFSAARWDLLVRQARSAGLLARLGARLSSGATYPGAVKKHLVAQRNLSVAQRDEVFREIAGVGDAIREVGAPVLLLKGAAYLAARLDASQGRLFSDVDMLVPVKHLQKIEACLMVAGWVSTHLDPYDQRYYREWMHELPPMQHASRRTTLDIHHSIVPRTGKLKVDPEKFFTASIPLDEFPGFRVLAPEDMVIHSATHLFYNEEFSHGLRDLSDLDLLLRQFGSAPDFWGSLVPRARELGLGRPLHYCLRWTQRLLHTPVPEEAYRASQRDGPGPPIAVLMDWLWVRVLRSPQPEARLNWSRTAEFLLYLRAHWMRMPPLMLVRHLYTKARMRMKEQTKDD